MENTNSTSAKLTVVIPSKNEGDALYHTMVKLSLQKGIRGTRVLVADSSDDEESVEWIETAKQVMKPRLLIERVKGGFPAAARANGAENVETEFLLFLDADTELEDESIINQCLEAMEERVDLLTVSFHTDPPYRWVYRAFYWVQLISKHLLRSPFALGGFQLWRTEAYNKLGGYDPKELFAEDYSLSRKVKPKAFKILNTPKAVYTSPRRFHKKGVRWMFMIMLMSYIKRNDRSFFLSHHGYWD